MKIQYLEIVTSQVDARCAHYEQLHDLTFCDGDKRLGGARTASLPSGGILGVRAPMHKTEEPTVRNYTLVDDINQALLQVESLGAEVIHPALELPELGKFAIYVMGGNQHGLWQL